MKTSASGSKALYTRLMRFNGSANITILLFLCRLAGSFAIGLVDRWVGANGEGCLEAWVNDRAADCLTREREDREKRRKKGSKR